MLKRIIMHWTAGAYGVNELERKSYNYIIDRNGAVVSGKFPPEAQTPENVAKGSNYYAAHTLNCNSGSIGVSVDAMGLATEKPFDPGPYPITNTQLYILTKTVAELAAKYNIVISRETTLSHAEVQPTLGIKQHNKWDITWLPGMSEPDDPVKVGDTLRNYIYNHVRRNSLDVPHPTISRGDKGPAVTTAQSLLLDKGFSVGRIDGVFGPLTEREVKAFQAIQGLSPDGIIGPKTWAALERK